jgi:hypothetical protein
MAAENALKFCVEGMYYRRLDGQAPTSSPFALVSDWLTPWTRINRSNR